MVRELCSQSAFAKKIQSIFDHQSIFNHKSGENYGSIRRYPLHTHREKIEISRVFIKILGV